MQGWEADRLADQARTDRLLQGTTTGVATRVILLTGPGGAAR